MERLNPKGEVFTVAADGTVLKRVSSFREIFGAYEDMREDWEVAWDTQIETERRMHKQNRIVRKAKLEAARGTVAVLFALVSALALFSVLG